MAHLTKAALVMALSLPLPALAQQTDVPQVEMPSATVETVEELNQMIEAPAPKVNAEASTLKVEEGRQLPEVVAAIAAEREALGRRADALNLREAEIAFATAALSEQERQLTQLKAEIERLLNLAENNHNQDVARLVKLYRAMKPVEAAKILSDADLEVTVLVLAAMAERDAGPIMAKMDQVRAQAVSKIILERSRLPGDQRLINIKIN